MRDRLNLAILKIGNDIGDINASSKNDFDDARLWDRLIESKEGNEFQLAIWGTQRLCYPALYHAYENFLRDVMSVRTADPNYRILRYEKFLKDAVANLGQAIVDECLTDPAVTLARLVRNAFAHKGGRLTKELRELKTFPFQIEDDTIQITAPDTTSLFNLLKVRVRKLAEVAIA